jgi:glucuronosyltransferase
MLIWITTFLLFFSTTTIHGYKLGILVPDMAGSQFLFNLRVGEVLADAGHDVTLIRLKMNDYGKKLEVPKKPRLTEWNVNGIPPNFDLNWIREQQASMVFSDESMWSYLKSDKWENTTKMMSMIHQTCEQMITNKEFMDKFKAANFDVVFSHMYNFFPIGMIHLAKPKSWIWLNSGALMDYVGYYMGAPMPPSYVAPILSDAGDILTFGQRFKSIIGHSITPYVINKITLAAENKIFKKHFGADFPDLLEIAKNASLVFVNSNELYDLPRPTLHKIVNIGGLGMKAASAKPLEKEYAEKVEKAENVIVFTFGSAANSSHMPQKWKNAFMNAFSKFPKTQFFFRYEGTDLKAPENVHLSKWLPQVDLLQHPKTRGFITHGGFNGLQEAILSARPLLVLPLMGDQFRNARIAEKHGFGIVLTKSEITEENIVEALEKLLNDPKYLKSVKTMNRMVLQKPIPPETLLIRWTEFLAEFNTLENLRPVGAKLNAITYYNLDVYATVVTLIGIVLFIVWKLFALILRKVFSVLGFGKSNKTKKE